MSYAANRIKRANKAVWGLAREHVKGAVAVFLASILALPLAAWGSDMRHEAWTLFVYGFIGPVLLYGLFFIFYWARVPAQLDAERVAEIHSLRLSQGIPLDEPLPAKRGGFVSLVLGVLLSDALFAALLLVGLGLAGLTLFLTNRGLNQLESRMPALREQVHNLMVAKEHADARAHQLLIEIQGRDGKGGYKAQIADLRGRLERAESKPVKTVYVRSEVPHSDNTTRIAAIAALVKDGNAISQTYLAKDDVALIKSQYRDWFGRVDAYLNKNLDPSYSARFEAAQGGAYGPTGHYMEGNGYWAAIQAKNEVLNQMLSELHK